MLILSRKKVPIRILSLLKYVTSIMLFLIALPSGANQLVFENEQEMLDELTRMENDSKTTPIRKLSQLAHIIEIAEQKQWEYAKLLANLLDVELELRVENPSRALQKLTPLYAQAALFDDKKINIRLLQSQIRIDVNLGNLDTYEQQRKVLLLEAKNIEDPLTIADIYIALGECEYMNSDYADAIKTFSLAHEALSTTQNQAKKAYVYLSFGNINNEIGNPEEAIGFFETALNISRALEDKFSISVILYNLGNVHINEGNSEKAKENMTSAKNISIEIDDEIGAAWASLRLADIAILDNEWQVAIDLYNEIEPVFLATGSVANQYEVILGKASALKAQGKFAEALSTQKQGLPLLDKLNSRSYYQEYNKTLAHLYYALGQYKKAFEIMDETYIEAQDFYYDERQDDIEKYRVLFDTNLKEEQNQLLQSQNALKDLMLQQQQLQDRFWAAIASMSALLLFVLAYMLYRQTQNRDRFKSLALKDYLTDSPNRRAILEILNARFAQAEQTGTSFAIGILDLDHFKQLNDEYGHLVGDNALKAFSKTCKKIIRQHDSFGRYGGEEWLIVFSDIESGKAADIFERLRSAIKDSPIEGLPKDYQLTFSMGIAYYNKEVDDCPDTLIKRADLVLYQAKSAGRDQVVIC
jgi:diguanylate cyclase (GGDEF)-like protein